MNSDQADAAHSRKVVVEGPNLTVVIGCDGGDQEVSEAETLACRPGNIKPVVNAPPCLLIWKENGKSRQDATEARIVSIRRAHENLNPDWSRKRDIARVEKRRKVLRCGAVSST
jgi:hypothetical protein